MQREPERADDAEVPASASQAQNRSGVIAGRRPHDLALGGDHLGLHEIVDGEPVLAHQPADAFAQADAADAGVAHDAARGRQTVRLCLVVDISPQGTALDEGRRSTGSTETARIADRSITIPPSHTAVPATLWTPAPHGDLEIVVAGEAHRCGHIGGAAAAGNQPRSSVDGAVPHGSGVVVVVVVGAITSPQNPGICIVVRADIVPPLVDGLIATSRCTEKKSAIWTLK